MSQDIQDIQTINDNIISSLLEQYIDEEMITKENEARQKRVNRSFSYSRMSKRKFVVEETSWGATIQDRQSSNYEYNEERGQNYDNFRHAAGLYWSYATNSENPTSRKRRGNLSSVVYVANRHKYDGRIPFKVFFLSDPVYYPSPDAFAGERNPFFEVKQVIRLRSTPRVFTDKKGEYRREEWRAFIAGSAPTTIAASAVANPLLGPGIVRENVEYTYLAYETALPFNHRQLDDISIAGQQYAKVRPEYNFYIRDYEQTIVNGAGSTQPETLFPNLYALMLEKVNDVSNPHFQDHITLGGTLTSTEARIAAPSKNKFDIKKHAGQYFDLYGRRLENPIATAEPPLNTVAGKFNSVVVPYENVELLKELSDKKELFPMFVDMEFSTDKMTEFTQILHDTHLYDDFMWNLVRSTTLGNAGFGVAGSRTVKFVEVQETSQVIINEDGTRSVERNSTTNNAARRSWSIMSWLKSSSLINFETGEVEQPDFDLFTRAAVRKVAYLDDGSVEDMLTVEDKNKFFKSLMSLIFLSKLKTFVKQRFTTYDQIMEGAPSYSETVAYRVAKFSGDASGNSIGEAIQHFWFPNSNKIDVMNYVDTQIKYGKTYVYKIYAYQVVVSNRYNYDRLQVSNSGAAFAVNQKPELFVVEQETFIDSHVIIDDPPVPPEVEIVPYFADGKNLLFNLKSAVGEYHLMPIIIRPEDEVTYAKMRRAQKVMSDDPIRFKSDDPIGQEGFFEIYRLEEHPQSYADFEGNLLASPAINPATGGTEKLVASSAAFKDTVDSNKKYYYTFRMVDAHGHVSNPTGVHEVEFINDEGSIYMRKRMVDFAPAEPKHPSKPMRRLIQIMPALEQTILDLDLDDGTAFDVENPELGDRSEAPWGRKFKFRICSKKTGKKIDLNVDFTSSMEKQSEPQT